MFRMLAQNQITNLAIRQIEGKTSIVHETADIDYLGRRNFRTNLQITLSKIPR